jgi:hypothetical protein
MSILRAIPGGLRARYAKDVVIVREKAVALFGLDALLPLHCHLPRSIPSLPSAGMEELLREMDERTADGANIGRSRVEGILGR